MNTSFRFWLPLAAVMAFPAVAQEAPVGTEPVQDQTRQQTQQRIQQRLHVEERQALGREALPEQAAEPAQTRAKQQQGVMQKQQMQQRRELRQQNRVERRMAPGRGRP